MFRLLEELFDFLHQVNTGLGQNRNRLKHGGPPPFPQVCQTGNSHAASALRLVLQGYEQNID